MRFLLITESIRIRRRYPDIVAACRGLRKSPCYSMVVDRQGVVYAWRAPALCAGRARMELAHKAWMDRCGVQQSAEVH